ncbi:glycoside hydrolase family 16 protein [Penicillium atrosanguineum]|nr:glycoside hydrolase family 16 protein [Penicillium atrosanguineum]
MSINPVVVAANCECGYSVNTTSSQHEVFTDLIESDFLTIQDISADTDWEIQRYWTPYDPSSGYYGENFTAANVVSNPLKYNYTLENPTTSQLGGDAGLQLWVRSDIQSNGLVPCGQVKTVRDDIQYGSFRTSMKLTSVNGTCSAFFSSIIDGYQLPNTSTYGRPVLPVALTDEYHEYRFDWMPNRVSFYFDGKWLWDLVTDVPSWRTAILLSHWSNGASGWTQGPPAEDAVMTVSYFKAYFNSSDSQRTSDYQNRCKDPSAANAICVIPNQTVAPGEAAAQNGSASTFFFSQHANMTSNQTIYTGENKAMGLAPEMVAGMPLWCVGVGIIVLRNWFSL